MQISNDTIEVICCIVLSILWVIVTWLWAERYYNSDYYEYERQIREQVNLSIYESLQSDRDAFELDREAIASDWRAIGFGYPYLYDPTYTSDTAKRRKAKKKKVEKMN